VVGFDFLMKKFLKIIQIDIFTCYLGGLPKALSKVVVDMPRTSPNCLMHKQPIYFSCFYCHFHCSAFVFNT
jgi:hypothetical protein